MSGTETNLEGNLSGHQKILLDSILELGRTAMNDDHDGLAFTAGILKVQSAHLECAKFKAKASTSQDVVGVDNVNQDLDHESENIENDPDSDYADEDTTVDGNGSRSSTQLWSPEEERLLYELKVESRILSWREITFMLKQEFPENDRTVVGVRSKFFAMQTSNFERLRTLRLMPYPVEGRTARPVNKSTRAKGQAKK